MLDWLVWAGILEDVNSLDDDEKAAAEEAMRRREVALNRTIVENRIVCDNEGCRLVRATLGLSCSC